MALLTPTLPDVQDISEWQQRSRSERLQVLTRHWVENGFGSPLLVYSFYLLKLVLYVGGAILFVAATPGIGGVGAIASWWDEGIVYQKLVVWTLLYEVVGLGCGSGPLTSRFLPPIGSILYWLRPGTIRLPPWPSRVPLTKGSRRTVVDVALYVAVPAAAVYALLQPGTLAVSGAEGVGLLDPMTVVPLIVAVAVLGLRDKTIFLAARGEQYWLSLFIFFFAYGDQLIGFKLVMLALWWGAATSKLNHHFPYVVSVMMSNAPLMASRTVKRLMYRDYPRDLRPSWVPTALAHVGTATEYLVPLFLVFLGDGGILTWIALIYMAVFHLHILSTVPMGVPLEWNVFFIFSLFYLFGAHGSQTVWQLENPWLLAVLLPSLLVLPLLGNVRPDLVSFLPAMRYYAGNWATSSWMFRPAALGRMAETLTTSCTLPTEQLTRIYDARTAVLMGGKVQAWRAMHSHGRAHNGLVDRVAGDDPEVIVIDGELIAGFAIGWNFGEGHLHDDQLLQAIQERCGFAPGDVRIVTLEGQPIQRQDQHYEIHDAASGLLETGTVTVAEMRARQPWPTDGGDYPVHDVRRTEAGVAAFATSPDDAVPQPTPESTPASTL